MSLRSGRPGRHQDRGARAGSRRARGLSQACSHTQRRLRRNHRGGQSIGEPDRRAPWGSNTCAESRGLIKNANSTWLIGKPLAQDLEAALARPVRLENDANCFALSEASARGRAPVVFGVILGTGVGGGIVVDGKVIRGVNAIAGEWGHNPLPAPTAADLPHPDCYCGRKGCIETYLSGPGLSNDHERVTGERVAPEQAVLREETIRRYEERLARSLAGVINVLDPDVIVLGGGCRTWHGCTLKCPGFGRGTCSPTGWRPGCRRRCTETRAG